MALIPVYHVVPSFYAVDPDHDATNSPIIMGEFVALNNNKFVTQANVVTRPVGIAGDTIATDQGYTPYAADIVVNSGGGTRSTSNRVSDFFNESLGSGKLTVYHSGGEFWTDRYDTSSSSWSTLGADLYTDANGLVTPDDPGSGRIVGRLLEGPTEYASGVPGTQVTQSISLGTFVRFALTL